MVADGVGDSLVLALGSGEVAADEARELGEFADHLGDEVGLGEAGGAFGEGGQLLPLPGGERVGVRGFGG